MKIVFPLENLHVLSGCSRVMFTVADICKKLGHEVLVVGDRNAAKPGPDKTVKVLRHYEIEHIREYYPLETLAPEDFDESINIFGEDAHEVYASADLVWTFSAMMDRIEDHVEVPDPTAPPPRVVLKHHWSYQHWPVTGDYPHASCVLHANSEYTRKAVARRWGREARVLHPPLPLDRYNPLPTFEERDVDLIYIGRVDPLKLGTPPALYRFKDLHTLIVGADNTPSFPDYNPREVTWIRNATFQQLADNLATTKTYVHWKGLLNKRDAEHLGITACEAMASGIPTIVPKVGGPWTDIAQEGRFCIGVDTIDEAISEVYRLCDNRRYWTEWHSRAVEGVQRFGYPVAEEKIKAWLDTCIQEGESDE